MCPRSKVTIILFNNFLSNWATCMWFSEHFKCAWEIYLIPFYCQSYVYFTVVAYLMAHIPFSTWRHFSNLWRSPIIVFSFPHINPYMDVVSHYQACYVWRYSSFSLIVSFEHVNCIWFRRTYTLFKVTHPNQRVIHQLRSELWAPAS